MTILHASGRKPLSPHEAGVTVKLPRALLDRVDRFAADEFHLRRGDAIADLLDRGLDAASRESRS